MLYFVVFFVLCFVVVFVVFVYRFLCSRVSVVFFVVVLWPAEVKVITSCAISSLPG